MITLAPTYGAVSDRHVMYGPNSGKDPYAGFPINCPDGSGYSIRLGNDKAGGQAEGISYELTIPPGMNTYSIVYHYAVVFQDPHHEPQEQPRLEIEVTNITDNSTIKCSSFSFITDGSLPGFIALVKPIEEAQVLYKNWSSASINLDGLAGKTVRLFFKTADCTFTNHFGYAYLDVSSECSSKFSGEAYCVDDTLVNIVAPYGYQYYNWYNNNFTQLLGTKQLVSIPKPLPGTVLAVAVIPFFGYGCPDTFYTTVRNTLTVAAFAGIDKKFCTQPVPLGLARIPNVNYSWSPISGLNNPKIANPLASPDTTTSYVLTVQHMGGGCRNTDTVIVQSIFGDHALQLVGKDKYCIGLGDSAILKVNPGDSIQWFKDGTLIEGAHLNQFRVMQTGVYHALVYTKECVVVTSKKQIVIDKSLPGIKYPVQYAVKNLPLALQARQVGSSVIWTMANNLTFPDTYNPVFKGSSDQMYTISLRTNSGCVTVDTQFVKIVEKIEVYLPSAFTPNSDGLNDVLTPTPIGMKSIHLFRIYSRWGQLLFETRKTGLGWDGTFNGQKLTSQVVVWMATGTGIDGREYTRKGTSLLVR